jgi:hypothetical protein
MDPALEKLKQALAEYLAAGGDTPVAPEAQALMDAIDQSGGQMGTAGYADPGQDPMAGPDAGAGDPTADMAGDPNDPNAANAMPGIADLGANALQGEAMPPQNAKTFEGARAGAKKRLKALNGK